MRKLTGSEVRLVQLLGLVLVVIAVLFVVVFYQRNVEALKTRITNLENSKVEADFWLSEKPFWDERRNWLVGKMPILPEDGSATSKFLEDIQQSASAAGVTIESPSLLEPVGGNGIEEHLLRMKANGTLEQFTRWLAAIQRPEKFQAISALNLKSGEPPTVICELQISRYYQQNITQ